MPSFSDNFNRADGLLGANWSVISGSGRFQIFSNIVRQQDAGYCAQIVNPTTATFSSNQEASARVVGVNSFDYIGPAVRVNGTTGVGYALVVDANSGNGYLATFTPSSRALIGTNFPVAVNDVVRIRAEGTTITAFVNDIPVRTVTDTTHTTGQPGLWGLWENGRGTTLDDFLATDSFAATTISGGYAGTTLNSFDTFYMPIVIPQNTATAALRRIPFILVDATDFATPEDISTTGQKVSLTFNGGATVNSTNDIVKVDGATGRYYLELTQAEANNALGTVHGTLAPSGCARTYLAAVIGPSTVMDAPASTTDIRNAILNWEPYTGYTLARLLRVLGIVNRGTLSGARTGTEVMTAPAGGATVTATADVNGNRTTVTDTASGTP